MKRRAEFDWSEVPYPETVQGQFQVDQQLDDHEAHTFLYLPDLTMETGWSTHRVPDRQPQRQERRAVGFRR